ncbi:MAG: FadR/GntR family transcriptional regulator [Puniceicoccaceae bacterium]
MDSPAEKTITHQVERYVTERIERGEIMPGDKLESERVLQKKLGISRFALREGLARLHALGLIRVHHGKGAFVAEQVNRSSLTKVLTLLQPKTDESVNELLEARTFLEGELCALACLRQSPEEVAALEANLEETRQSLDNIDAFCDCDMQFHQMIAQMAKNRFLAVMHAGLWDQILDVMHRNAATREDRVSILSRHENMLEAIRSGNAGQVRTLSEKFLSLGIKNYY